MSDDDEVKVERLRLQVEGASLLTAGAAGRQHVPPSDFMKILKQVAKVAGYAGGKQRSRTARGVAVARQQAKAMKKLREMTGAPDDFNALLPIERIGVAVRLRGSLLPSEKKTPHLGAEVSQVMAAQEHDQQEALLTGAQAVEDLLEDHAAGEVARAEVIARVLRPAYDFERCWKKTPASDGSWHTERAEKASALLTPQRVKTPENLSSERQAAYDKEAVNLQKGGKVPKAVADELGELTGRSSADQNITTDDVEKARQAGAYKAAEGLKTRLAQRRARKSKR